MANPYTVTYNFREQMMGNGDELKLQIIFQINQEGTDAVVDAEDDESIFISDIGYKEQEYELDEFLLTPSFYTPTLIVPEESDFIKYLFDDSETRFENAVREAKINLTKKISGSAIFINEFNGNIILESLLYNPDSTYLEFDAAPDMSILTKTMLFDLEDVPLDPLGYGDPAFPNDYIGIKQLLLDCYKLINPDLVMDDLLFEHDWKFYGQYKLDGTVIYETFDTNLAELKLAKAALFHTPELGMRTIADLLKQVAKDFCSFTGMNDYGQPFFKKIKMLGSPIVLDDESYSLFNEIYDVPKIDYCRVTTKIFLWLGVTVEYIYHSPNEEAFTGQEGSYILFDTISVAHRYPITDPDQTTLVSNESYEPSYGALFIYAVQDDSFTYPTTGGWNGVTGYPKMVPLGQLTSAFWYYHRSTYRKCRRDKIITPTDLRITDNVFFKGKTYQPLRVKRLYKNCKTEIEASIIG